MSIDPARPYRHAARHYAEHRRGVSSTFVRLVVSRLGLTANDRVLDLGCGPGALSCLLAPHVATVVAADPEPEMVDEGRRRCAETNVSNVSFAIAGSDDLSYLDGDRFRAVVIGQVVHWTRQRREVLQRLDGLVEDDGAVVAVSPEVMTYRPDWWVDLDRLLTRYLSTAPSVDRPEGSRAAFADALRRSPFDRVEELRLEYDVVERPDLRSAIGVRYSMPWVLDRLGPRRAEFEAEALDRFGWINNLPPRVVRRRDVALFGLRRGDH